MTLFLSFCYLEDFDILILQPCKRYFFFSTESCYVLNTISQILNRHTDESIDVPGTGFTMSLRISESCTNKWILIILKDYVWKTEYFTTYLLFYRPPDWSFCILTEFLQA